MADISNVVQINQMYQSKVNRCVEEAASLKKLHELTKIPITQDMLVEFYYLYLNLQEDDVMVPELQKSSLPVLQNINIDELSELFLKARQNIESLLKKAEKSIQRQTKNK